MKKKNIAALIIAKAKPKDEPVEDRDEMVDPLMTASDEVFEALKMDDKEMFYEALKSFVHMCMDEGYDESEDEE